jgi:hypothetical protein
MKKLGSKGESPFLRVRLPEEMLRELRKLADADERTVSNLVRKVLKDFIQTKQRSY